MSSQGRGRKSSIWAMEIGGKGHRDSGRRAGHGADDDPVDHPPFEPALPAVNLLPRSVTDAIGQRKVITAFVAVAALLAAGAAVLWWVNGSTIARGQDAVAQAEQQREALQADLDRLAPVQAFYASLTEQRDLVTRTLASQPQSERVVSRLLAAGRSADGVDFGVVSVSYSGIPAPGDALNACPNPDPFGTDITVGCVAFDASAQSRESVTRLLEILDADPFFAGPFVGSSSISPGIDGAPDSIAFSGSAGVSVEALATALTAEQIATILAPPEPAGDATADPGDGTGAPS
ncbi:MAG: hypothetical protein Q8M17_06700 [Actinomycetota bacterium]|nr:hypothetical protein [Actinomycetota bacterium]